jgi:uncharacterized DUF497 family protein
MTRFIWDDKNEAHIAEHGITPGEAEHVVENAEPPYPSFEGDRKWKVRGRTRTARYVQVIYVLAADASIDYTRVDLVGIADALNALYVIHARPLTDRERQLLRKKRKGR